MKEKIYTIPVRDAFLAKDECPLCFLEREIEQHSIDFVLGSSSSYMEEDIRADTDKAGFCRAHYKKMYDYGNRLGSALILSTHLHHLNGELEKQMKAFQPDKSSFFKRMKPAAVAKQAPETNLGQWLLSEKESCYICKSMAEKYPLYLDTVLELYKSDSEFVTLFKESKGFCLEHFKDLVESGNQKLNDKQKEDFYPALFSLMKENLKRLEEEVLWFTEKYDYRNNDKSWGNSRDSIQRAMQKLSGGYPSDEPYQADH